MTTRLEFAVGDVTELIPPPGSGSTVFIPHVANDVGRWGAGFTRALDRRWPTVRRDYLGLWSLWREEGRIPRGSLTYSCPQEGIVVVTMVAQAGGGRGMDRVDYVC